jgi:beta-lactam-binding protein with PASTA domain
MNWFKPESLLDIAKHLAVIGAIATLAIVFFFYIYLPVNTNHGETITVPDVIGVEYEQLDEYLIKRSLRYEIEKDSSYSPDHPPLAVLKQFPLPHAKVKENRKVYLTLNSSSPPLVRMPDLTKGSIKNALMVLKTYDLKLGEREYIPDLALNAVLRQEMNGREILAGEHIPKGSTIDLVLGDGYGNQALESPNLIGLEEESALLTITGSALKIGNIQYDTIGVAVIIETDNEGNKYQTKINVAPGEVYKQKPVSGEPMKIKQLVDIWIYKPDSLSANSSILDQ